MKEGMIDYHEMMRDMRRALDDEQERLTERVDRLNGMKKMADITEELVSELESLKEELEEERAENERLRQQLKEKEIQLYELSKLSVGVAKKSSQDDLQKALRTYINVSKRKTASKRVAVKMVITEMITTLDVTLPDDMAETLESLDDEQAEAKTVVYAEGDVKVQSPGNNIAHTIYNNKV